MSENADEPFHVGEPDRIVATSKAESGSGKFWLAFILVLALCGGAAYQFGYLQPVLDRFANTGVLAPEVQEPVEAEALPPENDLPARVDDVTPVTEEDQPQESTANIEPRAPVPVEVDPVGPDPMLVDFSKLPAADKTFTFVPGLRSSRSVELAIREDSGPVVVDFVRESGLSIPLTLRLEEVGFSGNRSPWASGQFALSNSGLIRFPVGQTHGRITVSMASDPLREADQHSTLRLRDAEFADAQLLLMNLVLEDDDQRNFESGLPVNTVAFAASQASIRESDPVVQIDLVRFNPDNAPLDVNILVSDITAVEGADYFAPGGRTVSFGPGQRSARILVPLVQDAEVETDEAFVVELVDQSPIVSNDVYRRIVVMIRDDDPQSR